MGNQKSLSTKDALKFAKKAEETGDKEKAQKYFEAILTTYPDNQDAVIGIKRLNPNSLFRSDIDELKELFKESKFWEVEVKCRNYLERYPEVQELYSLLGLVMGIKGAHSEALSHFKKAAEIIIEKTNSRSKIIYQPQKEAFGNYREITRRFANTDKAKSKFGYKVNFTSTEVIEEIIKVFKDENSSTNSN